MISKMDKETFIKKIKSYKEKKNSVQTTENKDVKLKNEISLLEESNFIRVK